MLTQNRELELELTRRKFVKNLGVLGAGACLMGAGCFKKPREIIESFAPHVPFSPESGGAWDYWPTSRMIWLKDSFFWMGSDKIIRKRLDSTPEVICVASGVELTYGLDAQRFYALGEGSNSTLEIYFDPDLKIVEHDDGGELRGKIYGWAGYNRKSLEQRFSYISNISFGYKQGNTPSTSWQDVPMLLRQPIFNDKLGHYDPNCFNLVYLNKGGICKTQKIDLPAGGSAWLECDPITGDWLFYPTNFRGFVPPLTNKGHWADWSLGDWFYMFSGARKKEYKKQQEFLISNLPKGYPVLRITQNFDIKTIWVPWEEGWTLNQAPRFSIFGDKIVATIPFEDDGGIYIAEGKDNTVWKKRFTGNIVDGSLGYSGDLKYLAWTEEVKIPTKRLPDDRVRSFRKVARIEKV
jgi:hypothetical protein